MELKLIKHDVALQELKEVWSAWTIEQNAYTTPWMEQGILKRMNDWAAGLHNAVDGARNSYAPERLWIEIIIASYYKGDIARLWSSRQRNEY